MFKSAELPFLVQFFHMFYNDKPVDWLLDHLIQTKICNWEKNSVSMAFSAFFYSLLKYYSKKLVSVNRSIIVGLLQTG